MKRGVQCENIYDLATDIRAFAQDAAKFVMVKQSRLQGRHLRLVVTVHKLTWGPKLSRGHLVVQTPFGFAVPGSPAPDLDQTNFVADAPAYSRIGSATQHATLQAAQMAHKHTDEYTLNARRATARTSAGTRFRGSHGPNARLELVSWQFYRHPPFFFFSLVQNEEANPCKNPS